MIIVLAIYMSKDFIIANFYPKEYGEIGSLVFLWAFYYLALAVRGNATILLQIYKKFKIITLFNLLTAIFTIILGYIFIVVNGVLGSIQSLVLGELVLALLLWRAFNSSRA